MQEYSLSYYLHRRSEIPLTGNGVACHIILRRQQKTTHSKSHKPPRFRIVVKTPFPARGIPLHYVIEQPAEIPAAREWRCVNHIIAAASKIHTSDKSQRPPQNKKNSALHSRLSAGISVLYFFTIFAK